MAIMSMLDATATGEEVAILIRSYAEVLNDLVQQEKCGNEFHKIIERANTEMAKVRELAYKGMTTDGDHHKQWCLVEIGKVIGMLIGEEIDEGTPP